MHIQIRLVMEQDLLSKYEASKILDQKENIVTSTQELSNFTLIILFEININVTLDG